MISKSLRLLILFNLFSSANAITLNEKLARLPINTEFYVTRDVIIPAGADQVILRQVKDTVFYRENGERREKRMTAKICGIRVNKSEDERILYRGSNFLLSRVEAPLDAVFDLNTRGEKIRLHTNHPQITSIEIGSFDIWGIYEDDRKVYGRPVKELRIRDLSSKTCGYLFELHLPRPKEIEFSPNEQPSAISE